ncbi:MAG TPA: hypothetical protein VFU59_06685 [Candidatus Eisenbacteria bacterium]|nr:hypothetical protein [Candidatus Eisenbacteria bacterium]
MPAGNAPAAPAPEKPKAGGPAAAAYTPEEEALLDRLADLTVRHRMTVPAILLLESVKPLSFLGSQALLFFEPMVRAFFSVPDYDRVASLLERRESLEALLVRIEAKEDDIRREEREAKAKRREARRAGTDGKDPS